MKKARPIPARRKSSGPSKPPRPKLSALGRRLIATLDEVTAHLRGEIELTSYDVKVLEQTGVPGPRTSMTP